MTRQPDVETEDSLRWLEENNLQTKEEMKDEGINN